MGGFLSQIIDLFTGNERPAPMIQQSSLQSNLDGQQTARPPNSCIVLQSAGVNDERKFFQIFFCALDQIPGYRGIGQRWEKEVQRVQSWSDDRYDMWKVWNEPIGYVETLQKVRELVSNEKFKFNRSQLLYWSNSVVSRRENQYKAAVRIHRADPQHQVVLEAWRAVRDTLQNLL